MAPLVLGTVQLGMPYGVANKTGKPDERVAIEIIRAAWEGGIREFDTAQEYGESERVLGLAFRELGITDKVRVVSKLAKNVDVSATARVMQAVEESLVRLGVPKLYGLLLHKELPPHPNPLPPRTRTSSIRGRQGAREIVGKGLVEHFGVSVYSPERALQAIETKGIDIVQIPSNILDRRFERAGVFESAKQRGVEVYVRSVFLQGLLLTDPGILPQHMQFARPIVERVVKLSKEIGASRLEMALGYIKAAIPKANIIVGAETPKQIHETIAAWNKDVSAALVEQVRSAFVQVDRAITDPLVWIQREQEFKKEML